MRFPAIALASALALAIALPMNASAEMRLGDPVVQLMPHVKKLRDSLNLDAEQNRAIDNWLAEAPAKRKQLEAENRALRTQMREAILNNENRLMREGIKSLIAQNEMRLMEMRALCTRFLRSTLNQEQFGKVVASYRAEVDG
jgi:hypothetical protein